MKIDIDMRSIKNAVETEFIKKGIAEPGDHIEIVSSNRYYNFWYGIVAIKGLAQLYCFACNIDTNEVFIMGRFAGDIKGIYSESDSKREIEEEYIYERLEPGDTLIISRERDSFVTAENEDGRLHIRRIKVEDETKNKIDEIKNKIETKNKIDETKDETKD